ncbi:hypothetical protein V5799_024291 [Amblyomma americanum]|uniref:Costars domain-containing protein n=1 Tax=Amblyomma americanum TaxID=6943 RepID=A0AAQ4ECJ2_AMBAM
MADQEEPKKEVRVFGRPELASKVAMFQKKAEEHDRRQKDNPFSARWDGAASAAMSKDDPRATSPISGHTRTITCAQLYTSISNKVVGILLRARKHGLVDFEGEMLYQRRDDGVVIRLLRPIADIHREMGYDPALAQLPKSTPVLLSGKKE